MTDPVAPVPAAPPPAPAPAPAPAPSPAPSSVLPAPVAVARPEWLGEDHWDATASTIKPEFGTHYAEIKTAADEAAARKAAAFQKAEDVKFEIKLPDGVTAPQGMDLRINDNDPRLPIIRDLAVKRGWDQDTVNDLVSLDAQMQIQNHAAEQTRIAAEDAKLGANAKPRKEAVANWLKGMKDRNEFSADEYDAVRIYATDAATVSALEKIMAKAAGNVPGQLPNTPPSPQQKSLAERMFPNLPSKAS